MKHREIDASLRAAEPAPETLADGFSPPADTHAGQAQRPAAQEPPEPALAPKSPFLT